jgi:hypothetical protein
MWEGEKNTPFTNGFSRYHHVCITKEDCKKTIFPTEWGVFLYTVIPFGLKNAPTMFYRIFIATFKEFMHKF